MDRIGKGDIAGAVLRGPADQQAAVIIEACRRKELRCPLVQPARQGERGRGHQEVVGIFVEQDDGREIGVAALVADILHEGAAAPGARHVEPADGLAARQRAHLLLAPHDIDRHAVRRAGQIGLALGQERHGAVIALEVFRKAPDVGFLVVGIDDEVVARSLVPFGVRRPGEADERGDGEDKALNPAVHAMRPLPRSVPVLRFTGRE